MLRINQCNHSFFRWHITHHYRHKLLIILQVVHLFRVQPTENLFLIKGVGVVFCGGLDLSDATMKILIMLCYLRVIYFFTFVCLMVIYLNHNLIKLQTVKQSRGKEIYFENRQQDRNTEIARVKYATCIILCLS